MTAGTYVEHLRRQLNTISQSLEQERKRLESSSTQDKIEALKSLAKLEAHHDRLKQRLAKAEERDAENWSEAHTGLREELDGLEDTIERWLLR